MNENTKTIRDLAAYVCDRLVGKVLIHSELSEALEEVRAGKPGLYFKEVNGFTVTDATERRGEKPEGVAVELADAVIRIADLCGHLGIDLEAAIDLKMAYNETRPFKHGKRF